MTPPTDLLSSSMRHGLRDITRRPGLTFLLYTVDLLLAALLSIPLYAALMEYIGPTGFGPDLARGGIDAVLLANLRTEVGAVLRTIGWQLLLAAPIYALWKVASGVGVAYALHNGGFWPFWRGVGDFLGWGLVLALMILGVGLGLGALVLFLIIGLASIWMGEVATFWINLVILPTAAISTGAVAHLMYRVGRAALIVSRDGIWLAFWKGLTWPFNHGVTSRLYTGWFIVTLGIAIAPVFLLGGLDTAGPVWVWFVFGLQQALLAVRAAASVGWIGSEVALYEALWIRSLPLIARDDALWPSPLYPSERPLAADPPPAVDLPLEPTTPPSDSHMA